MTFVLDSAPRRQGSPAVGSDVSVHYRTEGKTMVATAITAQPAKQAGVGETGGVEEDHEVVRGAALVLALFTRRRRLDRAVAPSTDTVVLRGHPQLVHVYGDEERRAGHRVERRRRLDSSRRRTWPRRSPRSGYFVVGFNVKAYLESFTSDGAHAPRR